MQELYRGSMQKVPLQRCWLRRCTSVTGNFPGRAVKRVTHHGMAQRRKMHADLVRPAGLNLDLQQRELAVAAFNAFDYLPVRNRVPSWLASNAAARGHARATHQVAANGSAHGALRLLHPAMDQRQIGLLYFTAGEMVRPRSVSVIAAGHPPPTARKRFQAACYVGGPIAGPHREPTP